MDGHICCRLCGIRLPNLAILWYNHFCNPNPTGVGRRRWCIHYACRCVPTCISILLFFSKDIITHSFNLFHIKFPHTYWNLFVSHPYYVHCGIPKLPKCFMLSFFTTPYLKGFSSAMLKWVGCSGHMLSQKLPLHGKSSTIQHPWTCTFSLSTNLYSSSVIKFCCREYRIVYFSFTP